MTRPTDIRIDEIDRRVLHALMTDARNTTAAEVADELNVSAGTIRNRLAKLEDAGVITGYHATVDFDRAGGKLTNLLVCTAPVADREALGRKVLAVPGVVDVRVLATGHRNLHAVAVGDGVDDLSRIARAIDTLGVDVESESLLQFEGTHAYDPFGPSEDRRTPVIADFVNLAGGSELVEFTITEDTPLAGHTLGSAAEAGLLAEDVLVVTIERDDEILTPKGDTEVRPDDVVTLFAATGDADEALERLAGSGEARELRG